MMIRNAASALSGLSGDRQPLDILSFAINKYRQLAVRQNFRGLAPEQQSDHPSVAMPANNDQVDSALSRGLDDGDVWERA